MAARVKVIDLAKELGVTSKDLIVALEGMGLARLPRSLIDSDLREGRLRTVLDAYAPDPLTISLVYPQRQHLPQRVRVFIDFMTEHFRKLFRGE